MVWPTLGSRADKEQNRRFCVTLDARTGHLGDVPTSQPISWLWVPKTMDFVGSSMWRGATTASRGADDRDVDDQMAAMNTFAESSERQRGPHHVARLTTNDSARAPTQ